MLAIEIKSTKEFFFFGGGGKRGVGVGGEEWIIYEMIHYFYGEGSF